MDINAKVTVDYVTATEIFVTVTKNSREDQLTITLNNVNATVAVAIMQHDDNDECYNLHLATFSNVNLALTYVMSASYMGVVGGSYYN